MRVDLRDGLPRGRSFDLVLAANVVCELPTSLDPRLAADLNRVTRPGGTVVVVEPASRDASGRALALRDTLVADGWTPRWPCPHAAACPTGWCHAEWNFERPEFMAEVDRRVGTRREVLKATCFALTNGPVDRPQGLARVISERRDEKGRSTVRVCRDGAELQLERQKRDRSEDNADFGSATRFDLLRLGGGTEVGGRLRIGRENSCVRVEDEGW
jgi:ribosomal protein RSM22 (predicted rRNA methylase)